MDKSGSENLLMSGGDRTGSRTAPGSDPHAELFGFPLTTSQQPAHCTLHIGESDSSTNLTCCCHWHPPSSHLPPDDGSPIAPPAICHPIYRRQGRNHLLQIFPSTCSSAKYPSFPDHRICLSFFFFSSVTLIRELRIGSNIQSSYVHRLNAEGRKPEVNLSQLLVIIEVNSSQL